MSQLFRVQPFLRRIAATKTTTRQLNSPPQSNTPEPKTWILNSAMKRGPTGFKDCWETKDGMYMWLLMPGIPKENVILKVIGSEISFKGTEFLDVPGIDCPKDAIMRNFQGSVVVDPTRFDAANVKAEIVNGVFWLRVPKFSH